MPSAFLLRAPDLARLPIAVNVWGSSRPVPNRRVRTLRSVSGSWEIACRLIKTARRLGMHRRTLQRKLSKHPVRERPDEI